ncbi:MAG: hypothetical protein PVJ09_01545 [Candidatus Woesebacteria bacterium]|jgi:hypothetical protein
MITVTPEKPLSASNVEGDPATERQLSAPPQLRPREIAYQEPGEPLSGERLEELREILALDHQPTLEALASHLFQSDLDRAQEYLAELAIVMNFPTTKLFVRDANTVFQDKETLDLKLSLLGINPHTFGDLMRIRNNDPQANISRATLLKEVNDSSFTVAKRLAEVWTEVNSRGYKGYVDLLNQMGCTQERIADAEILLANLVNRFLPGLTDVLDIHDPQYNHNPNLALPELRLAAASSKELEELFGLDTIPSAESDLLAPGTATAMFFARINEQEKLEKKVTILHGKGDPRTKHEVGHVLTDYALTDAGLPFSLMTDMELTEAASRFSERMDIRETIFNLATLVASYRLAKDIDTLMRIPQLDLDKKIFVLQDDITEAADQELDCGIKAAPGAAHLWMGPFAVPYWMGTASAVSMRLALSEEENPKTQIEAIAMVLQQYGVL